MWKNRYNKQKQTTAQITLNKYIDIEPSTRLEPERFYEEGDVEDEHVVERDDIDIVETYLAQGLDMINT